MQEGGQPRRFGVTSLRWVVLATLLALTGGAFVVWWQMVPESADRKGPAGDHMAESSLDAARAALERGDLAETERLALEALAYRPDSPSACLLAAKASAAQGRTTNALRHCRAARVDATPDSLECHEVAGLVLCQAARWVEAEIEFRLVLSQQSDHLVAHRNLATLLVNQGRRDEAAPHLLELIRQRRFTIEDLFHLGNTERIIDTTELLRGSDSPATDPSFVVFAQLALEHRKPDKAVRLARQLASASHCPVASHVVWGQALLQREDWRGLVAWQRALPEAAVDHPEVWFIRGKWAEHARQTQAAARCYWEAVRRDPNHLEANHRLGRIMLELDRPEATAFQQRAKQLDQFATALWPIYSDGPNHDRMVELAELAESMGRIWEAWAWRHAVVSHDPTDTASIEKRTALAKRLHDELPRTLPTANPALGVTLARFSRPDWTALPESSTAVASTTKTIQFRDSAEDAHLQFQYYNGDDPTKEGIRTFQEFGGGVGILDFDGDGWPDLYCSQGCDWPPQPNQTQHRDRLYRNSGNGSFVDVTREAGLGDERYSQGVAIGDYDNDGFPDIFLANIGRNRLYHNNGDGTFTDVGDQVGLAGDRWTTSCAMADLSGDGLPDLYAVNYLAGSGPFTRMCGTNQHPRACMPQIFPAEQDRMYLNMGDGTFRDVTEEAGVIARDGKGLGLVVAQLDDQDGLDLFVANDTTANFFFVNHGVNDGGVPQFTEQALLSGVALDLHGRAQACMGVAVGDTDQDGTLDLYVTNFYREHNTLYRQLWPGVFGDQSRCQGLVEPSYAMLGFGTQFLDADLDGHPDLIVANGHIDDYRDHGQPFRMPLQLFRNMAGRFLEIPGGRIGDAFVTTALGRSLARCDWNRDGRPDVVVMFLDRPAALLTNQTANVGHYVSLHLRGRGAGNRDAVGAVVQLDAGNRSHFAQRVAGDGFQAGNQPLITIGLGDIDQVSQLRVRWPSGREQVIRDVAIDCELIILEGHDSAIPMPR